MDTNPNRNGVRPIAESKASNCAPVHFAEALAPYFGPNRGRNPSSLRVGQWVQCVMWCRIPFRFGAREPRVDDYRPALRDANLLPQRGMLGESSRRLLIPGSLGSLDRISCCELSEVHCVYIRQLTPRARPVCHGYSSSRGTPPGTALCAISAAWLP